MFPLEYNLHYKNTWRSLNDSNSFYNSFIILNVSIPAIAQPCQNFYDTAFFIVASSLSFFVIDQIMM